MMSYTCYIPCILLGLTLLTKEILCLRNITLAGLFSSGGAGAAWDGSGTLYAAKMALEHINNNETILPGYRLNLDWRNSKCLPGDGMKGLFELLSEPPVKPILLGASCSVVSQPVAETAQHWNLVQMSFSSVSDVLSLNDRFKYFFRTCPTQSAMNTPRIKLMKEYGWKRIAVIYESNEYFSSAMDFFMDDLNANGIQLLTSESFAAGTSPKHQLENIKRKDARIIVASAYEESIRRMFCEAYKAGMYGKRYLWMIESWKSDHWWHNTEGINCTKDEMITVTEYYAGTVFLAVRPDDVVTVSGMTAEVYHKTFAKFTNYQTIPAEDFAAFAYDAIWAVALALHNLNLDREQNSSYPDILDFNYENTNNLRQRIFKKLSELQFEGISGPVSFDERGNRLGVVVKFEQLISEVDQEQDVAFYYPSGKILWRNNDSNFQFKGGSAPRDGPLLLHQHIGIHQGVFVTFTVFAVIGMTLTSVFLVFNLTHRKKRLIKLSCPAINNVIGVGCIMCHLSVLPYGLSGSNTGTLPGLCMIKAWILCVGFSLAFGGLFLKTWRVHLIFQNKTKRMRIFNRHLFVILGILIAFDAAILTLWTIFDPLQRKAVQLQNLINTYEDTITSRTIYECQSRSNSTWIGVIFVWKGLQLLYGAKLAWETRKVTVPELNDSKFIGLAIYNVAIPTTIVGPLAIFLGGLPTLSFAINSSCIILCTMITSCLVFLPKVIRVVTSDSSANNLQINTIANGSLHIPPFGNNRIAPEKNLQPITKNNIDGNNENFYKSQGSDSDKMPSVQKMLNQKNKEITALKETIEELRSRIEKELQSGHV